MSLKKPLEKHFQKKVIAHLKSMPNTWYFKASERSLRGIPDIIACVNGIFVAMELKRDALNKASPLQQFTIDQIIRAKGCAWVVSPENWDKTKEALKALAA